MNAPRVASIRRRAGLWAVLGSCVVVGCTGSKCQNTVVHAAPSPDGAFIAFVFHRSCGATASMGTHVSIIDFHDSLRNSAGNVLGVDNEQPVRIAWRSPKILVVSGFEDPTYQRTQPMDSITIEFR